MGTAGTGGGGRAYQRCRFRSRNWPDLAAIATVPVLVVSLCVAVQVAAIAPANAASSHATTVAAGATHSCRIQAGRAYCWGSNSNGQLGNGSTISSSTPVPVSTSGVLAGKTLSQITSGSAFTCALDSAGAAYCWGLGTSGQLGNNGTSSSSAPVAVTTTGVLSGKTLTQITLGNASACALSSAGAAYCWGSDSNGQLGNNSTTQSPVPVAVITTGVLSGKTLTQIAGGQVHTCAIDSAGIAYCWGSGTNGRLGNSGTSQSTVPVAVTASGVLAGKTLVQITAGTSTTCALDSAGAAYCWGAGASGQLGNNTTTASQTTPVAVTTTGVLSGRTLTQISANNSGSHACVLDSIGGGYCWGLNSSGQLGNPATAKNFGVAVAVTSESIAVAAGNTHACTISAGKAYCWGSNLSGQLGNGTTSDTQATPVAVSTSGVLSGKTLTDVAAGNGTTCALDTAGLAYCWGAGGSGQLGNGTTTAAQSTPVAVTTSGVLSGKVLADIAVGGATVCALDTAGLVYCWGAGGSGQLGNGTTTAAQSTPVAVTTTGVLSGKILVQLTGGGSHTCAADSGGVGYCWGAGGSGQLGNGTTTAAQTTAVAVTTSGVLSGKALAQITGGTAFTCALDTASAVYCWGLDSSGQLGNNGTTLSNVAVTVAPQGPTGVGAVPGDATAAVSWTAPVFLNGGTITGYAATAAPGGASCATSSATSCTITGLKDGTTYTITVTVTATTGTASSATVTVLPAGFLSLTAPASATLPGAAPGGTASAPLGTVTVTDNRALGSASWTATVSGTAFTTGSGTGQQVIPVTRVTYWSGAATATSGAGTFTPGQPTAADAVDLGAVRTAFSLTGGSGVNAASWNPTLSVLVPATAVAGTYTATITQSVS